MEPLEASLRESQRLVRHGRTQFNVSREGSPPLIEESRSKFDNLLSLLPPAEALISKSAFVKEEAKTGAPINFVKLQRLYGQERVELMNPYKGGRKNQPVNPTGIMSDYMVNNWHRGRLVYCRFGEKYM